MLSPDSRTIAFDLLRPPSGYTLDLAVLTTYTLDLEALLALPLSVVSETEGGLEDLLADPLLLLEALRRAGERIQLFVDRSGIAIPRAARELYSMLEASVHPVRAPGGGVFHPKVWVARFKPREPGSATAAGRAEGRQDGADDRPLLRVAVLTRNLTFDRSWDVALASEAHPDLEGLSEPSQPLADLIRALPDLATTSVPTDSIARVRTLADQVGRARFPAPPGFFEDPIRFHVVGLHGARAPWRPISDGRRTLAIAPFVNRTGLQAVRGPASGKARLVSLQSELDKLPDDALSAWEDVRTLPTSRSMKKRRIPLYAHPACMPSSSPWSTAGMSPGTWARPTSLPRPSSDATSKRSPRSAHARDGRAGRAASESIDSSSPGSTSSALRTSGWRLQKSTRR